MEITQMEIPKKCIENVSLIMDIIFISKWMGKQIGFILN